MRRLFFLLTLSVFLASCAGGRGDAGSYSSAQATLGITPEQLEESFANAPQPLFLSEGEWQSTDLIWYKNDQAGRLVVGANLHPAGNLIKISVHSRLSEPLLRITAAIIMATNPGMSHKLAVDIERSLRTPHTQNPGRKKSWVEISSTQLDDKLYVYGFNNRHTGRLPSVMFIVCPIGLEGCSRDEIRDLIRFIAETTKK